MTSRILATAICALVLAGCAKGQDYVTPTAPVASAYKETPPGWRVAEPADLLDRGPWWLLFNDPLLDELERKVEVSNQTLAGAEAAYRQARALVREQRASFFPTVTLDGTATRSQASAGSSGIRRNPETSYRIDIGATWEPDVWGRIRNTVTVAEANAEASAADLASARLSAQGELATNYLQLRSVDAAVELLIATVDAYREALRITRNRYDAGIAPMTDVLQAETQLTSTEADLEGLDRQRAQLEHAVAVLVGQALAISRFRSASRPIRPSPRFRPGFRPSSCSGAPTSPPPSGASLRPMPRSASRRRRSSPTSPSPASMASRAQSSAG